MIYFTPLNPIRFYQKGCVPKAEYIQKYATGDDTFLQIVSSVEVYVSCYVVQIGRTPQAVSDVKIATVGGVKYTTFRFSFFGMRGKYRIEVDILDHDSREYFESGMICVCDENNGIPLIQYRNIHNKDHVYYGDKDVDPHVDFFSLRLEGGFQMKSYVPKSIDTIYMGGDLRYTTLHSHSYHTRRYTAGDTFGISDEMFDVIHHVLGCDTIFIDGKGWTKFEGAAWSANEIDLYPLRTWEIEVAPTGSVLERWLKPEPPEPPEIKYLTITPTHVWLMPPLNSADIEVISNVEWTIV